MEKLTEVCTGLYVDPTQVTAVVNQKMDLPPADRPEASFIFVKGVNSEAGLYSPYSAQVTAAKLFKATRLDKDATTFAEGGGALSV